MPDHAPDQEPAEREPDWKRRRRLDELFGEGLPQTTTDERDDERPRRRGDGDAGDEWLRAQVPPHHGG